MFTKIFLKCEACCTFSQVILKGNSYNVSAVYNFNHLANLKIMSTFVSCFVMIRLAFMDISTCFASILLKLHSCVNIYSYRISCGIMGSSFLQLVFIFFRWSDKHLWTYNSMCFASTLLKLDSCTPPTLRVCVGVCKYMYS